MTTTQDRLVADADYMAEDAIRRAADASQELRDLAAPALGVLEDAAMDAFNAADLVAVRRADQAAGQGYRRRGGTRSPAGDRASTLTGLADPVASRAVGSWCPICRRRGCYPLCPIPDRKDGGLRESGCPRHVAR